MISTVHKPASRWRLIQHLPRIVAEDTIAIARDFKRSWRVLWALTVIESQRKYAGSFLGTLWYPLYAALLLASYSFVYLVVMKMKFKEFGSYTYVLFVFAGLIPYLGLSEAVATSTASVRQSMSILKNAIFPIEFVPVKFVCAALFGLMSSLGILVLMIVPTKYFGLHILYLPVAVAMLFSFCVMTGWVLSGLAVFLPDILQVINIILLLLMFMSPIGYTLDMVPDSARFLVYFNPLTYLIEAFRFALLGLRFIPLWADPLFILASVCGACVSGSFFRRLSPMFADYE